MTFAQIAILAKAANAGSDTRASSTRQVGSPADLVALASMPVRGAAA